MSEISETRETPEIVLRAENLGRRFGDFQALKGLSFTLERGEVCGFIGPNGAGKTTAMRILATLDVPSEGEVWVCGDSALQHADRVRPRIGFMPDQYGQYEDMSCEEYLDFFARAYDYRAGERRERVEAVIAFTGLEALRAKLMSKLSKGMKQRLCLGRSLLHDPELLLFDEPAAGLDPRARAELRDLILELSRRGKTVFVSSHILGELEDMCTHVAILEGGELKYKGPIGAAQHAAEASTRYRLRALEAPEQLLRFLIQQPLVGEAQLQGREVELRYEGDEKAWSALLTAAMGAGFAIVESRQVEGHLEAAFLAMTRPAYSKGTAP